MEVTRDVSSTRQVVRAARQGGRRIGLVPTMGALHSGHVSLIEAARRDETYTVVSIFVNPTQFGPNEDYQKYPRAEDQDLRICERRGTDLVFMPPLGQVYHPDAATTVHVARLTDTLCGAFRPLHFDGVATVCAKLFNIVQPDVAYFGQKDVQQLAVLRRMVRDLNLPLEIVACPTVREDDGLAVSSRNAYLSAAQRRQATSLYRALGLARARIQAGAGEAESVTAAMRRVIEQAGPARIDYISIVDPESMQPVARITGPVLVAVAVHIGQARLIDNLLVDPASQTA